MAANFDLTGRLALVTAHRAASAGRSPKDWPTPAPA